MELNRLANHLIYDNKNSELPDQFVRFGLMCPEYSVHEAEVKPYPMQDKEQMFALFWDIHDGCKLSSTVLPTETPFAYHMNFNPPMRTQMHSHEYMELFYIIEGEYRQKILGNEFTFHKGELCLIDKNCLHQELLDGTSAKVLFLGITNVMFNDIMERKIATERIASFLNMALLEQKTLQQYLHFQPQSGAEKQMEEIIVSMILELKRHDVATPFICQGILLRLFWVLSTQYEFSLSKKMKKKVKWIMFEEITEYMRKHLRDMSITRLAEEFHFQEDYFNRFIKEQTGLTYTEYLQSLRLQRAENLLQNTDYTIDKIVKDVGYKNKGYFYKIFIERYGITPAQFRRKIIEHR